MTARIYAMPPVRYLAGVISHDHPVAVSTDARTGVEILTGFGASRRIVGVTIQPLAGFRDGAGYMDVLTQLLQGVHFVRLRLPPINWHLDQSREKAAGGLNNAPLGWVDADGNPVEWTAEGNPALWFANDPAFGTVTTLNGFPAIAVTGLPPNRLVCRAGDTLRSYAVGVSAGTAQAVTTVFSSGTGTATIPLLTALPAGVISFFDMGEIVARATQIEAGDQPTGAGWSFRWAFREALPYEYAGADEVNPWLIA
jgi:hypothetical protein